MSRLVQDTISGKPVSIIYSAAVHTTNVGIANYERSRGIREEANAEGAKYAVVSRSEVEGGRDSEDWHLSVEQGVSIKAQISTGKLVDLGEKVSEAEYLLIIPLDTRYYIARVQDGEIIQEVAPTTEAAIEHLEPYIKRAVHIHVVDVGARPVEPLVLLDGLEPQELGLDLFGRSWKAQPLALILTQHKLYHPAQAFVVLAIAVIVGCFFYYKSYQQEISARLEKVAAQKTSLFDAYSRDWSASSGIDRFATELERIDVSGLHLDRLSKVEAGQELYTLKGDWSKGYPFSAAAYNLEMKRSGSNMDIDHTGWSVTFASITPAKKQSVRHMGKDQVIPSVFHAAEIIYEELNIEEIEETPYVRSLKLVYVLDGTNTFQLRELSQALRNTPTTFDGAICSVTETAQFDCKVRVTAHYALEPKA